MVGRERFFYPAIGFLNTLAWGIYYSFTRRYLTEDLAAGSVVMLLAGLEWGMSMASLLSGLVERYIGSRRQILIGVSSGVPVILSGLLRDPYAFSLIISISSLLWSISWPVVLSMVFTGVAGWYGRVYSNFTIITGVGFGIGAILAGFIYGHGGPFLVLTVITVLLSSAFALSWVILPYRNTVNNVKEFRLKPGDKSLLMFFISLTLIVFARETFFAVGSVKLNGLVDSLYPGMDPGMKYLVYGLVYGLIGSLISPFARLLSGYLVDKYGALNIYAVAVASYLLTYWGFTVTNGLAPIILWQIPVYPFLDTSVYAYVAGRTREASRTQGFGNIMFFTSLGGLMLIPSQPILASNPTGTGVAVTASSLGSLLVLFLGVKREEKAIR
ncbi:MAG: MFS transporter [Thermogladius sp.]|nr:MFS transporter [Thermogladius sp.]